jgi:hypothetical protein
MLRHLPTLQILNQNQVNDYFINFVSISILFLVVPCSLEELQPLLEHLMSNKPGPNDDNQSIVFSRGTIMTGGRLDLCKQVVGPQGIQPLLNAIKHSSVVNRILLGKQEK